MGWEGNCSVKTAHCTQGDERAAETIEQFHNCVTTGQNAHNLTRLKKLLTQP